MTSRPSIATELGRLYDNALASARIVARLHGYALAVHGSQLRDLDLIAVPWVPECSPPDVLAEAIRVEVVGVFTGDMNGGVMHERPHGRLCWSIVLREVRAGLVDDLAASKIPFRPYLDLSVIAPRWEHA